jgi:hypothetical protein
MSRADGLHHEAGLNHEGHEEQTAYSQEHEVSFIEINVASRLSWFEISRLSWFKRPPL